MIDLVQLRKEKGLRQKEAADIIGVSRTIMCYLETGRETAVRPKTEDALCQLYGLTPIQLLGIDNLKHKPNTIEEVELMISLLNELKEDISRRELHV